MRMAAVATALGLTLIAAAGLAACAPEDPLQPPDPAPSRTPVFASEEEALAAAEELYGKYQDAANALGQGGWVDSSLLEEFVRGDALEDELATSVAFAAKGYRQTGETLFDSMVLQQLVDDGAAGVLLTVYLCLDVSGTDIIDQDGNSIVSADRQNRLPLEVDFDDLEKALKVSRSEAWSGENFC